MPSCKVVLQGTCVHFNNNLVSTHTHKTVWWGKPKPWNRILFPFTIQELAPPGDPCHYFYCMSHHDTAENAGNI